MGTRCDASSFSDPDDLPGLAHFTEHMLFLGTDKFPAENEYSTFLNAHGGSSNAYTDSEDTVTISRLLDGSFLQLAPMVFRLEHNDLFIVDIKGAL